VEKVLAILAREEYSSYPIFEPDGNHFSGFVHVKDLFAALRRGELQRPVHELQHGLLRLSAAMPLGEALEQLRAKSAHMAVVADESGSLAGLVTVEDLIEELFGEIRDEFDAEEMPRLEAVGENRWRASGRVPLLDLEEAVGVRLQSSSPAETVAAYVLAGAGRVPREGERLELDELFITVERVQDNAVASCVVELRQLNS
jgi:CBS domain containing-hemolysin-like protein